MLTFIKSFKKLSQQAPRKYNPKKQNPRIHIVNLYVGMCVNEHV